MRDPDLSLRRPPDLVLALLCAATVALPTLAALGVTPVGGFRMFTDPIRYRIVLAAEREPGAVREIPLATLHPHVTRDTRRVLRGGHEFRVGETQARLLADDLEPLARLACRLDPERARVWVRMELRDVRDRPLPAREVEVACR